MFYANKMLNYETPSICRIICLSIRDFNVNTFDPNYPSLMYDVFVCTFVCIRFVVVVIVVV